MTSAMAHITPFSLRIRDELPPRLTGMLRAERRFVAALRPGTSPCKTSSAEEHTSRPCLEWTGRKLFVWGGRRYRPQRLAFELTRGELRANDVLVCTCSGARRCIEPEHHEVRSPLVNFAWKGDDVRAQRALATEQRRLDTAAALRADEASAREEIQSARAELAAFDRYDDEDGPVAKRLCILSSRPE